MNSNNIKDFYSKIQFPGHYIKTGLDYHIIVVRNPYLNIIDQYLADDQFVLDVGCGTGLISNLFASKYRSQFIGVDFSDSIDYAKQYAKDNKINNVQFVKADFVEDEIESQFDVVICQGVLHHMPNYEVAAEKLMRNVKPGGYLVVGLYHPAGKLLKKFMPLNYGDKILMQDQEENPFELSFAVNESLSLFSNFKLIDSYPKINVLTTITAFLNYKNGGLITYIFKKNKPVSII